MCWQEFSIDMNGTHLVGEQRHFPALQTQLAWFSIAGNAVPLSEYRNSFGSSGTMWLP